MFGSDTWTYDQEKRNVGTNKLLLINLDVQLLHHSKHTFVTSHVLINTQSYSISNPCLPIKAWNWNMDFKGLLLVAGKQSETCQLPWAKYQTRYPNYLPPITTMYRQLLSNYFRRSNKDIQSSLSFFWPKGLTNSFLKLQFYMMKYQLKTFLVYA